MAPSCRSWWVNCAGESDEEIARIDAMEDRITPVPPGVSSVRQLISTLELCHHKSQRWVANILEAIAAGQTNKGLGTRSAGRGHSAERVWQNACAALSAWCAGRPAGSLEPLIDTVPASEMLARVGTRSPLKQWQVQRVADKIRSQIHWPQPLDDPAAQYTWLLLGGGEYELLYRDRCPEQYAEHEDFWLATVRTLIHDTDDGQAAKLSLALAIDMLWPCHWRFVENLQIVLDAIGGYLEAAEPFAACGRNIGLVPTRAWLETVCHTLRVFFGDPPSSRDVDPQILAVLAEPTEVKRWLAASLEKTIRLQLSPPADLRAISSLAGPAWIKP
ncbi:MAG: hypothetical protein JXB62_15900 [Pirellulales bacterium]|nr:hypothetical protein [Pirellulales bacterium]